MALTTRLCAEVGCPEVGVDVRAGWRCPAHRRDQSGRLLAKPAAPGYNDRRWRRVRAAYIAEHPRCEAPGCTTPARIVHHVDHRGPLGPRGLDWENLASLCAHHHREVTVHPAVAWAAALERMPLASPRRVGRRPGRATFG